MFLATYSTTNTTRNYQKQTFHCWDMGLNAVKRDEHLHSTIAKNPQIHTRELERSLAEIRHTPKALLRASACVCFPQSACWKMCSFRHANNWNILKKHVHCMQLHVSHVSHSTCKHQVCSGRFGLPGLGRPLSGGDWWWSVVTSGGFGQVSHTWRAQNSDIGRCPAKQLMPVGHLWVHHGELTLHRL